MTSNLGLAVNLAVMGLRERNAERTREMIIDTALSLFLQRGYDATRMEEVAEAAGIGTSTLYRYFPTKDLLLIEPLAFRGKLADGLRSRPAEEPLEVALGHALENLFFARRGHREQLRQIRSVVDSTAVPRMRLLEEFVNERTLLEVAIAERLGRPTPDVFCVMTARMAAALLEYIAELSTHFGGDEAEDEARVREACRSVTRQMTAEPPVIPVFTDAVSTDAGFTEAGFTGAT